MEWKERGFKFKGAASKVIEKYVNYLYDNHKISVTMLVLYFLICGIGIYMLNKHTTMIVDDYGYSFSWVTGKRIESVQDIILSQYKHYFTWGGRSVVHFLAQYFLMFNKSVFDIANTLAYLVLMIVTYFHAVGKAKLYPSLFVIINFCFFAFMPAFGQVFLWIVGACNYLWGPLLTFTYLLPYRFQLNKDNAVINNKIMAVLFGLLGVICAWTNENLGVTVVCLIFICNLFNYIRNKKLYFWSVCGLIGSGIGATLLILAPGNYVRLATFHDMSYLKNFIHITKLFVDPNYLLLPLAGMLIMYIVSKNNNYEVVLVYLAGLMISMYSMVGAPYYADRAKLGSLLFVLILIGYFYTKVDISSIVTRKVISVIMLTLVILTAKDWNQGRKDIKAYEVRNKTKVEFALAEKAKGNLDVVLPNNYPGTRYCAAWGLEDINKDPKHWTCTGFAHYFALRSVRTK